MSHFREKSLKDADDPVKKKKKKKKTGSGDSLDRTVFVGNLPVHYTKKVFIMIPVDIFV